MGIKVITIDESERFLSALEVSPPEAKRKAIGREFIRSFEEAQRKLIAEAGEEGADISSWSRVPCTRTLLSPAAATAPQTLSHHNVGGLPDDLTFELVEPLRTLFRTSSRYRS